MSAYIKSLNSNHLVATGSEDIMNTDSSVYLYSGLSGANFDANLAIKRIDYGAYRTYPDRWCVDASEFISWGEKWITDHATVVMEEYGMKSHNVIVYEDPTCSTGSSESLTMYKGVVGFWDTQEQFVETVRESSNVIVYKSFCRLLLLC
ncbi:Mannan endo-1 [Phytophthora citrophthora]|uniref:Mannan endo-1 n=1 Tax=Phytophthora citrophthora TaxID=4793 RepID=A0AAD9GNY5_9STRA|nr:Mannan endo-1 [Phytophthora citrophthora]